MFKEEEFSLKIKTFSISNVNRMKKTKGFTQNINDNESENV